MERADFVDMARSLLMWPFGIAATIAFGSLSMAASLISGAGGRQHFCMRAWARTLLALGGVRWNLTGADRLPGNGSYIIASNHQSMLDILVLAASFPCRFGWVAKRSLFRIPFLGWHMARAGYIPIDRGRRGAAARLLLRSCERISAGASVAIFPEQTRSTDGRLGDFHGGAALLAIKAGVPIVPVAIAGTGKALPKGSIVIRSGTVDLEILDPLDTSGLKASDKDALTQELRRALAAALGT